MIDQLLAVDRIAEVRGIVPVTLPLPSGAVQLVAQAGLCQEDVVTIHADGSATPERGRTVPAREVLEHGC